jgi:hypothetical protein
MTALSRYLDICRSAFGEKHASADINRIMLSIELQSDDPMPFYRLVEMAEHYGRLDLWKIGVTFAFALVHDTPQAIFHRARACQRLGKWSGWRDRQHTLRSATLSARQLLWTAREYDGSATLRGKTLLVLDEGGFGDTIQALCFVRPLAARAGRVILVLKRELVELAQHNLGDVAEIVATRSSLESERYYDFDQYLWILSAPRLFGRIPEYEQFEAPLRIGRERLNPTALQIGVCWAASDWPSRQSRCRRSLDGIMSLAPLLELDSIEWQSLQVGPSARTADLHPRILQPQSPLTTFADTANLIAGLDAVVTIDTAVAHLAGRLGVPTFLLLEHVADEKWGLDETTPWYPFMRLIRQSRFQDWQSALNILKAHLLSISDTERTRLRLDSDGQRSQLRLF